MISERKLRRFQLGLLVAGAALLAFYWFAYRSLAGWARDLDKPAVETWRKLVATAQRNPNLRSLDEFALKAGVLQMQKAAELLLEAGQSAAARIGPDAETRHRLDQEFQLLEFEQSRMQLSTELKRAANGKKVQLADRALEGLPAFDGELPQPSLLWAQLAFARQLLEAAIAAEPRAISNLTMLTPVARPASEGRQPLFEFPMRIEMTGSPDSITRFLATLPLRDDEVGAAGLTGLTNKTQALFAGRFILRNSSAVPNETSLETVVSGFCEPPKTEVLR